MITRNDEIANTLTNQMSELLSTIYGEQVSLKTIFHSKAITIRHIQGLICYYFNVEWEQILSPSRTEDIVLPRMCFNYLCMRFTSIPPEDLGAIFNKHRTSVLQNCKSVEGMLFVKDQCIYRFLQPIIEQLTAIENEAEKI